jgi:hypothetical protein
MAAAKHTALTATYRGAARRATASFVLAVLLPARIFVKTAILKEAKKKEVGQVFVISVATFGSHMSIQIPSKLVWNARAFRTARDARTTERSKSRNAARGASSVLICFGVETVQLTIVGTSAVKKIARDAKCAIASREGERSGRTERK